MIALELVFYRCLQSLDKETKVNKYHRAEERKEYRINTKKDGKTDEK